MGVTNAFLKAASELQTVVFFITKGAEGDFSKAAWRVYTYFKQASEIFLSL
jgi:hypothetical protein